MSQTFYKKGFLALAVATALGVSSFVQADVKIGVAGPMTGANAAFGDPKVDGVTCYLSRAKTGGMKGGLGLAEDRAEASIACRQTGPISCVVSRRPVLAPPLRVTCRASPTMA